MMLSLASTSCGKDDDDKEEDETELITTMNVVVQEVGGATQTFTFRDPDGPGGAAPTRFDSILLTNNRQYNVSIQLLNESKTPSEDKTPEIQAEANDHQFYFEPTGVNVNVTNLNLDSRNLPLGLTSTWNAAAASTGKLKITLKHKPGTKAAGDPVTKGETDIAIEFGARVR
jgi:hypothetical protein